MIKCVCINNAADREEEVGGHFMESSKEKPAEGKPTSDIR